MILAFQALCICRNSKPWTYRCRLTHQHLKTRQSQFFSEKIGSPWQLVFRDLREYFFTKKENKTRSLIICTSTKSVLNFGIFSPFDFEALLDPTWASEYKILSLKKDARVMVAAETLIFCSVESSRSFRAQIRNLWNANMNGHALQQFQEFRCLCNRHCVEIRDSWCFWAPARQMDSFCLVRIDHD